jgi:hypothetical protein
MAPEDDFFRAALDTEGAFAIRGDATAATSAAGALPASSAVTVTPRSARGLLNADAAPDAFAVLSPRGGILQMDDDPDA